MSTTSLFVGALLAEILPVLRKVEHPTILSPRLVQGQWNGHNIIVLRCSVGPKSAYYNTMHALKLCQVDQIISLGTCGALSDHLAIGTVCTSDSIQSESGAQATIKALPDLPVETLITVHKPVFSPERRDFFSTRATICEMEAFSVWKAANGIPFHTLKVVSDHAGRDPDPAMSPSRIKAHRIALFMLRAGLLSRQFLVPAINTLYPNR